MGPTDEYSTCMLLGMALYTVMWHNQSTSRCILPTPGVLAGMWACGIVVMLTELFAAESKSQVYAAFHELLSNHTTVASSEYVLVLNAWECVPFVFEHKYLFFKPEFVCYDDGCHLRRYATNPCRRNMTPQSIQLAKTEIVVDKFHMAGHTDT